MPPSVGLFDLRFPVKEDDEPTEASTGCCDEDALCQYGLSTVHAIVHTTLCVKGSRLGERFTWAKSVCIEEGSLMCSA